MVVQQTVVAGISSWITSGLTSIFGGGKAVGGNVNAGVPYVVGEQGREMFVPNTAGRIMSAALIASAQSGGAANQPVMVNVYANDAVLASTLRGEIAQADAQGVQMSRSLAAGDAQRRAFTRL